MRTRTKALSAALALTSSRRRSWLALLATAGGLLAAWVGWGLYVDRTTETVPSETVAAFDGVEVRRYPQTVLAETTAENEGEAFIRLFRYISGANEASEEVAMTAPVATTSSEIPMTAPVRTTSSDAETGPMTTPVRTTPESESGAVTMAFSLPAEYGPGNAPTPTDSRVRLVVEPPRTLAARSFSWYATDERVERNLAALRDALADRDLELRGRPVLLQYDDPWTPPFMRRNEVAVAVEGEFE